jgi:hypothetical protein
MKTPDLSSLKDVTGLGDVEAVGSAQFLAEGVTDGDDESEAGQQAGVDAAKAKVSAKHAP